MNDLADHPAPDTPGNTPEQDCHCNVRENLPYENLHPDAPPLLKLQAGKEAAALNLLNGNGTSRAHGNTGFAAEARRLVGNSYFTVYQFEDPCRTSLNALAAPFALFFVTRYHEHSIFTSCDRLLVFLLFAEKIPTSRSTNNKAAR
jgi:hypothetical protein